MQTWKMQKGSLYNRDLPAKYSQFLSCEKAKPSQSARRGSIQGSVLFKQHNFKKEKRKPNQFIKF